MKKSKIKEQMNELAEQKAILNRHLDVAYKTAHLQYCDKCTKAQNQFYKDLAVIERLEAKIRKRCRHPHKQFSEIADCCMDCPDCGAHL